jgi:hypothetical protein
LWPATPWGRNGPICEINQDLLRPDESGSTPGGNAVIKMRRAQLSFGEGLIAEQVSDLAKNG